jgi:hypothetical protein
MEESNYAVSVEFKPQLVGDTKAISIPEKKAEKHNVMIMAVIMFT